MRPGNRSEAIKTRRNLEVSGELPGNNTSPQFTNALGDRIRLLHGWRELPDAIKGSLHQCRPAVRQPSLRPSLPRPAAANRPPGLRCKDQRSSSYAKLAAAATNLVKRKKDRALTLGLSPQSSIFRYALASPGTGGMIGFSIDGLVSAFGFSVRVGVVGSSSSNGKPATSLRI